MATFRVEVWRTIEVIEQGYLEVDAENHEQARGKALDQIKLCVMPKGMELGDTVGTDPWATDTVYALD